ncbi:MAG: hypothetical protein MMC23_000211 [Stictis urceolatum]|nr:hypothetical protein [Stictis urceolata]
MSGFIVVRFHALHGNVGPANVLDKISAVLIVIISLLGIAQFGSFAVYIGNTITDIDGPNSSASQFLPVLFLGIQIANISFFAATSINLLGFAIRLLLDQRRDPKNRIPLALLLATSSYTYRSLATLIFLIIYSFTNIGPIDLYDLIQPWTYSLPTVPVFAGLVWAGRCADWEFRRTDQEDDPEVEQPGQEDNGGAEAQEDNDGDYERGVQQQQQQQQQRQSPQQWDRGYQQWSGQMSQQGHPEHGPHATQRLSQNASSNGTSLVGRCYGTPAAMGHQSVVPNEAY